MSAIQFKFIPTDIAEEQSDKILMEVLDLLLDQVEPSKQKLIKQTNDEESMGSKEARINI